VFPGAAKTIAAFHLRTVVYCLWLPVFLVRERCFGKDNIVFTNDPRLAVIAIFYKFIFRYRLVFECHGEYTPRLRKLFYTNADRIIFISRRLREHALKDSDAYGPKSAIVLNGVDIDRFVYGTQSSATLREELDIVSDGILIGYMIRALAHLPPQYRMLFVGGIDEEIRKMEALARSHGVLERIAFRSFVPTEEIPKFASACDVLCYVPETISFQQRETIPMKLFEYMAARRPIVVSDTPAVREILDESSAHFCKAGSVGSFVSAITGATEAPPSFIERAYVRAQQHTWRSRAKQIIDFCTN
jgi:glycosyltransferase involved in cell wall biosynthesis